MNAKNVHAQRTEPEKHWRLIQVILSSVIEFQKTPAVQHFTADIGILCSVDFNNGYGPANQVDQDGQKNKEEDNSFFLYIS